MSDIIIEAREIVIGLLSLFIASLIGWRMYFMAKWQQLDRIEKKLDNHIADENVLQKSMNEKIIDIWKEIAGQG